MSGPAGGGVHTAAPEGPRRSARERPQPDAQRAVAPPRAAVLVDQPGVHPGAAVGCTTVPLCGPNPNVDASAVWVQMIHRTLAVLLVLHLFGMVMMLRKRRDEEAPIVVRAAKIALGMVVLQLGVASAMILMHMPPVFRSLHEATGVGIWLSCFALAYLARRTSGIAMNAVLDQAPAATVHLGQRAVSQQPATSNR